MDPQVKAELNTNYFVLGGQGPAGVAHMFNILGDDKSDRQRDRETPLPSPEKGAWERLEHLFPECQFTSMQIHTLRLVPTICWLHYQCPTISHLQEIL